MALDDDLASSPTVCATHTNLYIKGVSGGFQALPPELIQSIFCALDVNSDILNLALTCKYLYSIFTRAGEPLCQVLCRHISIDTCRPYDSYNDLCNYFKSKREWLIASGIWISSRSYEGGIYLTFYDDSTGQINLARLDQLGPLNIASTLTSPDGSQELELPEGDLARLLPPGNFQVWPESPEVYVQRYIRGSQRLILRSDITIRMPPTLHSGMTSQSDSALSLSEMNDSRNMYYEDPLSVVQAPCGDMLFYVGLYKVLPLSKDGLEKSIEVWPPQTIPSRDRIPIHNPEDLDFQDDSLCSINDADRASCSVARLKWSRRPSFTFCCSHHTTRQQSTSGCESAFPDMSSVMPQEYAARGSLSRDPSSSSSSSSLSATDQNCPCRACRGMARLDSLARLDNWLWTPTKIYPWRGIWISWIPNRSQQFKNIEILLFHQPTPYQIQAIKLYGYDRITRGECIFIVDDLRDIVKYPDESSSSGLPPTPMSGARSRRSSSSSYYRESRPVAVNARVADSQEPEPNHYKPSQLFLNSNNQVDQYVIHQQLILSFFRLDIRQFMQQASSGHRVFHV